MCWRTLNSPARDLARPQQTRPDCLAHPEQLDRAVVRAQKVGRDAQGAQNPSPRFLRGRMRP